MVDNQKELELLANTFRSNPTVIELIRVESMSRGAALGAELITWVKDTEETVEVPGKWLALSSLNCAGGRHRGIQ